jgi:hypothetical protein
VAARDASRRHDPAGNGNGIADSPEAGGVLPAKQPCFGLGEIGRIERLLFTPAWLAVQPRDAE